MGQKHLSSRFEKRISRGRSTHVKPVDRFIPARTAETKKGYPSVQKL